LLWVLRVTLRLLARELQSVSRLFPKHSSLTYSTHSSYTGSSTLVLGLTFPSWSSLPINFSCSISSSGHPSPAGTSGTPSPRVSSYNLPDMKTCHTFIWSVSSMRPGAGRSCSCLNPQFPASGRLSIALSIHLGAQT
jgi:hypothetical protein